MLTLLRASSLRVLARQDVVLSARLRSHQLDKLVVLVPQAVILFCEIVCAHDN